MPTSNKPQFMPLTKVSQITYGYPFNSKLFSSKATNKKALVRIRDVLKGYTKTYTSEICDKSYLIHKGDLLVGMDGEFNISEWKSAPAYLNQRVCRIEPIGIDRLYLKYFLQIQLKKIEDRTTFVTVKHLSAKALNNIIVSVPSAEYQRKISSILNIIDNSIFLQLRRLNVLNDLVKSQFVLMFGDAGNYYLHNKIVNITDVAKDIFAGGDKPKDFSSEQNDVYKHPVYSNGEKNSGLLCYSKTARVYDVALTVSARGTLGFSVIRNKPFTPVVRLITIIPNNKCNITYLKYCLDTVGFASSGTSQGQITVPDFKSRKIPLPSMDNQIQFENIIKRIDKSKFVELRELHLPHRSA